MIFGGQLASDNFPTLALTGSRSDIFPTLALSLDSDPRRFNQLPHGINASPVFADSNCGAGARARARWVPRRSNQLGSEGASAIVEAAAGLRRLRVLALG